MQTVVWSDSLELGHERIDAEHRLLMDIAADIEVIVDDGGNLAVLQSLYQEFHRLLQIHCAYEEGLLRSLPHSVFGAQVDSHCQGHARLITQARSVADGSLPEGYDTHRVFANAYFQLMHDLLIDDAELIGALIREGRHAPRPMPGHSSSGYGHPPV